jgi:hypothetical protein
MSGYTRRPSTSSVESEDTDGILWKQESSIVKSVPKDLPSDDWPIFELRDAVVLNKDGKSLENALNVVTNGPFIVRGHLYIDDSAQRIHCTFAQQLACLLGITSAFSSTVCSVANPLASSNQTLSRVGPIRDTTLYVILDRRVGPRQTSCLGLGQGRLVRD